MKKIYVVLALLLATLTLGAQNFRTGYFLDGYQYRYKMNPAFDVETDFVATVFGQANVSVKSPLSLKNFLFPAPDGNGLVTGLHSSVDDDVFLSPLNNKMNPLIAEHDLTLYAHGFRKDNIYHVIDATFRAGVAVNLPYDMFEFMKTGTLRRSNFDMTSLLVTGHSWLELSYSQSVKVSEDFTFGARVKGLAGLSYASVRAKELTMNLSEDIWELHSDLSLEIAGGGIKYGMVTQKGATPDADPIETDQVDLGSFDVSRFGLMQPGGVGLAVEGGVEWKPMEHLTVSAAILDLGCIKWFDSIYAKTPEVSFRYDPMGIEEEPDKNAFNSLASIADFRRQDYKKNSWDLLTASVIAGAEYELPFYEKVGVGLMGMYRVDNLFHWGELRGSVNYRPWQWLSLSVSGAYNSYGWEYGASLAVHTKLLHFFIGSDALLQEVTPQFVPIGKLNHNLTFGLGIQL